MKIEASDEQKHVQALHTALRFATAYVAAAVAQGFLEGCAIPASLAFSRLAPLAGNAQALTTFLDRQAAMEHVVEVAREYQQAHDAWMRGEVEGLAPTALNAAEEKLFAALALVEELTS
jgi:hypothetical protein